MQPLPYIGVTGVTQKEHCHRIVEALGRSSARRIMFGELISDKTMRGQTNKWPMRYPKVADIGKIFINHPSALNLVHFNTKTPRFLFEDMYTAQQMAGELCSGFQLNMVWPSIEQLREYRDEKLFRNRNTIVLQCGARAMEALKDHPTDPLDPLKFVTKVREYRDLIDYVLIDPSGGLGIDFKPAEALGLIRLLHFHCPKIGVGVAGGLNAANVQHKLFPILNEGYRVSCDSESQLRDSNDELCIDKVLQYVKNASSAFYSFPQQNDTHLSYPTHTFKEPV